MEILRTYGSATTVYVPLIDAGAQDFESTPVSFAAGDVQVSKDGGAFNNIGSLPTHEGNGIYSIPLTAAEMQAAVVVVTLIDQTATKAWEDQSVVISTYGHASAEHTLVEFADALLIRDWTSVTGEAARSALNAFRFLRNKWSISGGTLTVTEEDDATSAWTSSLTTDSGADPVTASDPN